jgi:hypothetical protein
MKTNAHPVNGAENVLHIPASDVGNFVLEMAKRHNISYTKTFSDHWGETVTRLADDDVETDDVEHLLIELKRAGKVNANDMVSLLVKYLSERPRQSVRPI